MRLVVMRGYGLKPESIPVRMPLENSFKNRVMIGKFAITSTGSGIQ